MPSNTQASVLLLAIESSCDDTAAAVMLNGKVLANKVASQSIHEQYGGVVPELAGRAHQRNILPVVDIALREAGVELKDLSAVAFTKGPGLIGSLMVGAGFAKSLSLVLNIPLIGVHHMEAHVLAHFIDEPKPQFPFLCLTVSGGHTQIVRMDGPFEFEVIGRTIDDAAGEAFDKAAKMLGLPYPGGPLIDRYARQGEAGVYSFPQPRIPGLDFSFSGLKTSLLYFLQKEVKQHPDFITEHLDDLCASFQDAIVRHLMDKLTRAAKKTGIREISLAGGVSANSALRNALTEAGKKHGWNTYVPAFEYCTDNAAMIAMAAHFKYERGEFESLDTAPHAR